MAEVHIVHNFKYIEYLSAANRAFRDIFKC